MLRIHAIKYAVGLCFLLLEAGLFCGVCAQDVAHAQDTVVAQNLVPPSELRLADDEVVPISSNICRGTTLEINGDVFQKGAAVTVISIKTAQGVVVNYNDSVSPTETTEYIMTYKNTSGESTVSSTVTVWQPAYIRVVGDTAGGDVCEGQTLSFKIDSSAFVQDRVRWTLSTGEVADYGNEFSFTPTQSCVLYINASNDYCGSTERAIRINYFPKLTFGVTNVSYFPKNYTTCSECTFALPDGSDWQVSAIEGEIEKMQFTWEDGSTDEKTLVEGPNQFQCRALFTVTKSNVCGRISKDIQKMIYVNVRGLHCEPEVVQQETMLSPCEWTPVYLYAPDVDSNHINSYTNAQFTISPAWQDLDVIDSLQYSSTSGSIGWEQVFWLRPRDMDKDKIETTFSAVYAADYTVACPYSTTKPVIAKSVRKDGTIRFDSEWLNVNYTYCDRYPGKLEIVGNKTWLKMEEVLFDNIPADSFAFKFPGINQKYYNTVHIIRTKINPNFDRYKSLDLRIVVSRDLADCYFKDTIVKTIELQEENYCDPYYTFDYDWNPFDDNHHCVGSGHAMNYQAPLYYQYIDSLKIRSSDFKISYSIEHTADFKRFTCLFQPYFSSKAAEDLGSQTGYVRWQVYYHDLETNEVTCDTFSWKMEIRPCPPVIQNAVNPDCLPRSACLSCPGSEWITSVAFPNPSTDMSKVKIRWIKPPLGQNVAERLDTSYPYGDSLVRKVNIAPYAALWRSHYWLYEPSDISLEVTYNEGDSIRVVRMDSMFRIDAACVPRLELQRDSCCAGDKIGWNIYADFYKYFLKEAQWENPSSAVYGQGSENYGYPTITNRIRPRLSHHTFVEPPGLYPYTVQYKVNDTLLTYSDTLRIHALKKPGIFIEDSIYICKDSDVDLASNIDSTVVREIIGKNRPEDLILRRVDANRVYPLTARMKYTCDQGNQITKDLYIFAERDVYLSCREDSTRLICPLDSIPLNLNIGSNGRLHWIKQCWKDGVLESQQDTIWKSVRWNRSIFDRVAADSAIYTVVAFTACPKPAETASFKAVSQPVPKIDFYDLHTCYPDSLHPQFLSSGTLIANNSVQWFLNDAERWPPYAPTLDTLSIRVMAMGENGCWVRAEEKVYNYPLPTLQVLSSLCFHAEEEDTLVLSGADTYVWTGGGRPDANDAARYILTTGHDTEVYVVGTEWTYGCATRDTIRVRLYAPRLAATIDTLCRSTEWKQPFWGDSLTRMVWYFSGADFNVGSGDGGGSASGGDGGGAGLGGDSGSDDGGDSDGDASGSDDGASGSDGADVTPFGRLVGRDSLTWPSLQLPDTGLYTRISYRVNCIDTQRYLLRLHPLPEGRLHARDVLCEHDTISMFYTHNARQMYPGKNAFTWLSPDGSVLATSPSADTVYYSRHDVQPADSGWYAMQMTYGVCQWLDSLHLSVYPIPYPGLPIDTFFCEKQSLVLDAYNPDYPNGEYTWQDGLRPMPGNDPDGLLTVVRVQESGTYTATLTANGCTGERAVKVEERLLPVFYMPTDTMLCRGEECVFRLPDRYDAYAWYEEGKDQAVGYEPWHGFMSGGRVKVEVTHRGCTDSLTTFIDRVFCGRLYFASAFTPNGNNVNDLFGQISVAEPEDLYYELSVFNHDHQMVFHTTNPTEMWDGTFKGVNCAPGVYTYICRASVRRSNRDVSMTGRIVLIR